MKWMPANHRSDFANGLLQTLQVLEYLSGIQRRPGIFLPPLAFLLADGGSEFLKLCRVNGREYTTEKSP